MNSHSLEGPTWLYMSQREEKKKKRRKKEEKQKQKREENKNKNKKHVPVNLSSTWAPPHVCQTLRQWAELSLSCRYCVNCLKPNWTPKITWSVFILVLIHQRIANTVPAAVALHARLLWWPRSQCPLPPSFAQGSSGQNLQRGRSRVGHLWKGTVAVSSPMGTHSAWLRELTYIGDIIYIRGYHACVESRGSVNAIEMIR